MPLDFATHWEVLAFLAAIVVSAALVNLFAPDRRWIIRRLLLLYLTYLTAVVLTFACRGYGAVAWAERFLLSSHVLEAFLSINIGAALFFDLVLPKLGIRPAKLISDLTIGMGYIVGTGAVLAASGFNLSSVLTTGAVFSAVLALSLQTTLGNVLGGVALQLDGSVAVGDWVQIDLPGGGKQGLVKEIRWRHTVIETRDFDTLIVPNSQLLASAITILGRRGGRKAPKRMWVYFNVDFRYSPARVIEVVRDGLLGSPITNVAPDPPPNVVCMDLAREHKDSFALYAVRYWILDLATDDGTSSNVRSRIFAALRRADIPLARPTTTQFLHLESDDWEAQRMARHRHRRLAALHTVSIFAPLTEPERDLLEAQLEYVPFTAGEKMTRQGAVAHWLYILTSGTAEVRVNFEDGPTKVLATLESPNFFGEMGLMTGEPRLADVIAVSEVDCFRLRKEGFQMVLLRRPEIARELSERLAERRIELLSASGDASAPSRKGSEQERIFSAIKSFFGLSDH